MKYKIINKCTVCKKKILRKNKLLLKNLPITEVFFSKPKSNKKINFNQKLQYCEECNHLSLAYQYDVLNFYNDSYLNSSNSFSNQYSNDFFLKFIKKHIEKKKYNIIEIGANDLYLLKKFQKNCAQIVAIDPCIKENKTIKNITYKKQFIEKIKRHEIKFIPDLVFCNQTLEHIENPIDSLYHISKFGNKNTKYFFQFPSCESIIGRNAFDQIHHQHLNYFSLNSISKILKKFGLSIIDHDINELHYGSLMIYFKISKSNKKNKFLKNKINLNKKYQKYQKYIENIIDIVKEYKKRNHKVYAIGASLMTPILDYHLNGLIKLSDNILDDDKEKINKYFPNIRSKIKSLKNTDLTNAVVIISATASSITTRKLVSIVENKKSKIIIVPSLSF